MIDEDVLGEEYESNKPDRSYKGPVGDPWIWNHPKECPKYCPYPDTDWVAPGALLPKCRGGDCTLCDELDCTCALQEVDQ